MSEPRLCYVEDGFAYFTTQRLADQWGDDWNDAPYEHNAGTPYEWREELGLGCRCFDLFGFLSFAGGECGTPRHEPTPPVREWRIEKVAYDGDISTPADLAGLNSRYSVQDINARRVPWLQTGPWAKRRVRIWAGASLEAFSAGVSMAGGTVYVDARAMRHEGPRHAPLPQPDGWASETEAWIR